MERYRNLSGESGVQAYQILPDAILVRFAGAAQVYRYSHTSAGKLPVAKMKRLARAGRGLATCITRHMHDRYEH